MLHGLRLQVARTLISSVKRIQAGVDHVNENTLASFVSTSRINKKMEPPFFHLTLSFKHLKAFGLLGASDWPEQIKWARNVVTKIEDEEIQASVRNRAIAFQLDQKKFAEAVLGQVSEERNTYGCNGFVHDYVLNGEDTIEESKKNQTVLIDFSSPNIAKPFHAGHLRSTIIGNFIANINTALGNRVTKLNYLGDWGTQFGLLGVGFSKYGSQEQLYRSPMQHLFEVYVMINGDLKNNPELAKCGKDFFKRMEEGEEAALSFWQQCRELSIKEYKKVYQRLNMHFDKYDGESLYWKKSLDIVQRLKEENILEHQEETGVGIVNLVDDEGKDFHATVLKSDGATMYLTRDLAAAIDRYNTYKFDQLYYVVENGQNFHFKQLIYTLRKMGQKWAERPLEDFHIKFGLIEGMSTRHGNVVFLNDILDEARDRMVKKIKQLETSKITENIEDVADILGMSAVIIQDFTQRRVRNYKFSWNRMLQFEGQTGVYLQYSHARMCSIERNCGVELDLTCDLESLSEPHAQRLMLILASYDETVDQAFRNLEPSHIVNYMFQLCQFMNAANNVLRVKDEAQDVAKARLLLFHCARVTLANAMRLVGLQPLERM